MKNTLISMTQFVLRINEIVPKKSTDLTVEWKSFQLNTIKKYANFLSQHLTLGMFVPCNDAGEVLEEPKQPHTWASENADEYRKKYDAEMKAYQAAKDRVLFEGFRYDHSQEAIISPEFMEFDIQGMNVESLILDAAIYPVLTPYALKQIGINEIPETKC